MKQEPNITTKSVTFTEQTVTMKTDILNQPYFLNIESEENELVFTFTSGDKLTTFQFVSPKTKY